ncbi:MAG TPA: DUF1573 domain-containing protein, partial [Planctomycetota bacterium]|nr:DUF1573 domain-containing protein [Planctomycetota bacterium]
GPLGALALDAGGDQHAFGAIVQGAQVEHTFRARSTGEHDLVIHSTKTSCGCSVPRTELVGADGARTPYTFGTPIPPGTELELTVRLDSAGKRGKLHSQITVYCNDPRSQVALRLEADILPFLEISPNAYVNFGRVFANEQREGRLTVTSPVVERFLLSVRQEGLPEFVQVELVPKDADAEGRASSWEVVGRILPGAPESPNNNWPVQLETDVPIESAPALPDGTRRVQSATVYLVAEVAGLVSARPNYVSFGLVRAGARIERTVRIEIVDEAFTPGAMPVRVVSRNPAEQALFEQAIATELTTVEPGRVYELRVTLGDLPDGYNQPFGGHLEVQVGHPTRDHLAIAFTGVARGDVTAPQAPLPVPPPVVPG